MLLAVHGLNDHRGAFSSLAERLAPAGIAVYSYDQRGFGATRRRGDWVGIGALAGDLRQHLLDLRRAHPGVPLFVLGESMGAAVAVTAFSDSPLAPDGLILSAPAILGRETLGPVRSWLVALAASLFPDLTVTRPPGYIVTDDPDVERQLARDPLLIGPTRLEVVAGVVALMDAAARRADRIRLPALLLYGRHDPVVPPLAVQRLAAALRGPVRLHALDGYHLLLRGRAADISAARILGWLARQPGYRASAPARRVTERCDCRITLATDTPAMSACRSATSGESSNATPDRSS